MREIEGAEVIGHDITTDEAAMIDAMIAELEARFLNMENNGIETGEY